MLKKITLAALFAITFTVGASAANARAKVQVSPTAQTPHGFCWYGMACG